MLAKTIPPEAEEPTLPAAGRTLDALIAARVFGQHPLTFLPSCYSTDLQAAAKVLDEFRRRWRTDDPEEEYWELVDCQEYGWRADVMWAHHDGPMTLAHGVGETLAEAICRCALVYVRGRGGEG